MHDFSMTVAAIRGTATKAMIKATPTRNCEMLEDKNALELYRKDAKQGLNRTSLHQDQYQDQYDSKPYHKVGDNGLY